MPPPSRRWLILADDLTGAADAAGAFRRAGHRALVQRSAGAFLDPAAAVVAIDLAMRDEPEAAARGALAGVLPCPGRRPYLKIDSTLRGPFRAMVAGALERCGPAALVCPAFPTQGRTVIDGGVFVDGRPIAAAGTIERQFESIGLTAVSCRPDTPGRRAQVTLGDAATDDDLAAWARAADRDEDLLCAGSAGLAGALAALSPGADPRPALPPAHRVVVVAGSANEVTHRQIDRLVASATGVRSTPIPRTGTRIDGGFSWRGAPAISIFATARGEMLDSGTAMRAAAAAIGSLDPRHPTAWVLTGGSTARAALDAAAVTTLEIGGEIEPGIPWTIAVDGALAGSAVVTKAGGFGGRDSMLGAVLALAGAAR